MWPSTAVIDAIAREPDPFVAAIVRLGAEGYDAAGERSWSGMTIVRGPSNDRLLHPAARRIRRSSATGAHPVRGVGRHAAHHDGQMLEQHRQVTQRLESIEPVRLRWMATADEGSCAEVAARYEDLSAVLNVQLRREVTEVMPADRRELFKEIPAGPPRLPTHRPPDVPETVLDALPGPPGSRDPLACRAAGLLTYFGRRTPWQPLQPKRTR